MGETFICLAYFSVWYIPGPQLGLCLKTMILLSQYELFLPGWSGYQKKRRRGRDVKRESGARGCERQTPRVCLGTAPIPSPLILPSQTPPPLPLTSWPYPHLHDPGKCSFSNISLERITKVFSLALLSCDQSIAQEMGSLKSCLSKISYFTSWSIFKRTFRTFFPKGKYFSYLCPTSQAEATHTLLSKRKHHSPVRTFPFVLMFTPPPPPRSPSLRPGGSPNQVSHRKSECFKAGKIWRQKKQNEKNPKPCKSKLRWECFLLLIKNRVPFLGYLDELRVNIYSFS